MSSGILVIDKPDGLTSASVVARVKRRLGLKKVGHTGTLDPMATGVLPLVIGEGTKIASYLLAEDKEYEGSIELGVTTNTLDAEGETTGGDVEVANTVATEAVLAAMKTLTGTIEQVPPMFSALSRDGVRLHKLARQGKTVDLPPRAIEVAEFRLVQHDGRRIDFKVSCSKGTYVRCLARDLGEALGCGAHLASLRRTRAGAFTLEHALLMPGLEEAPWRDSLVSLSAALAHMPAFRASSEQVSKFRNGLRMEWAQLSAERPPGDPFKVLGINDDLLAIVGVESGRLRYHRVFNSSLT